MSPMQHLRRWRAAAEILLWRHGWAAPAGAALMALAAAMQVFAVQHGHFELESIRAELSASAAQGARRAAPAAGSSEQENLRVLQAALKVKAAPDEMVRKMVTLAEAEHIGLSQSDYQQQFHDATQVMQVRVTQPMRATYPQLRRYVESVLREIPNASLDQIAARRDNVGQAQLEARLRWSLWIAPAAGATTARTSLAETP